MKRGEVILVDMDGPLAEFEKGSLDAWRKQYPDRSYLRLEERKDWWSEKEWADLHPMYPQDMLNIVDSPGFFFNLKVVEGSKEALDIMINSGYVIKICSTPRAGLQHTEEDKYNWLLKHFSKNIAESAIFTQDKTGVFGNYLIDDKPYISGSFIPQWKQILWDMPFNQQVNNFTRVKSWREVLEYLKLE